MSTSKQYWFPAKRYGWGWGLPATWQGWAVLAGFLLLIVAGTLLFSPQERMPAFIAYTAGLSVLFAGICYIKGEPPSWRWGEK